jgi:DNA-binding transcriptional ArsR family regulator
VSDACRETREPRKGGPPAGVQTTSHVALPSERLARLIGRRRAIVLSALQSRTSLDELAAEARVARSTASEHLSTLVAIGLVRRRREGRWSRYQLTEDGVALLELLRTDGWVRDPGGV